MAIIEVENLALNLFLITIGVTTLLIILAFIIFYKG